MQSLKDEEVMLEYQKGAVEVMDELLARYQNPIYAFAFRLSRDAAEAQDITQEYANLKNQLETTRIVYDKMMQALQKRQVTIPEAMRLESELSLILLRVESLKNRIDYLNNAISFTTITVYFHEPQVSLKALKESKQGIKESMLAASIGAVKFLARAIP